MSKPHFAVSCQHYSFAVNAFVDVIREFDAYQYDFTIREEPVSYTHLDVYKRQAMMTRESQRRRLPFLRRCSAS